MTPILALGVTWASFSFPALAIGLSTAAAVRFRWFASTWEQNFIVVAVPARGGRPSTATHEDSREGRSSQRVRARRSESYLWTRAHGTMPLQHLLIRVTP